MAYTPEHTLHTLRPSRGHFVLCLTMYPLPPAAVRPAPDRVNNVERVYITHPSPGAALTITVTAHSLPSRLLSGPDALLPQRWAVAVVGHFSGTLASELNPAYVRQGQLGTRGDSGGGGMQQVRVSAPMCEC